MFSFMKKDKADKREKKDRKDTKKPQTKDAAAAASSSLFQASGSGSGGVVYGASAGTAASVSSANDKLTADELLRLDEVRRSLKIRTRRKEKEKLPSGITADYTAHLGLHLVDGGGNASPWPELHSPLSDGGSCTSDGTPSLNSLTSTTTVVTTSMMMKQETFSVTAPMPVPPARGILKGKSSYGLESPPLLELDDDNKLVENTLKNELIIYEKPPAVLGAKKSLSPSHPVGSALPPPLPKSQPPMSSSSSSANGAFQRQRGATGGGMQMEEEEETFTYSRPRPHLAPLDAATAAAIAAAAGLVPADNSRPSAAASPAATAAVTAKPNTTAVKVLWSELPGEGSGWLDHIKTHKSLLLTSSSSSSSSSLPLPALIEPALPEPRDLTLQRKETGDFGFSLRRSVVVERSPNDPSRYSNTTIIT